MRFSDWLRAVNANIRFSDFKLHLASTNPNNENPLDLFRSGHFTNWQTIQTQKNFERPFVLALIRTLSPDEWLFAGVFRSFGLVEDVKIKQLRYNLAECPEFLDLTGRAVLHFRRPGRQSYLNCENWIEKIDVVELTRQRIDLPAFPGYRRIELPRPLLRQLVERSSQDWRIALSQVSGVYVARDRLTHQLYIGSATGVEGIWQRWSQYAAGDGGNAAFKALFKDGGSERLDELVFSLVETADFNATDVEILERESHWKRVLGTRMGLNQN